MAKYVPHLQFETTYSIDPDTKHAFAREVTNLYADHMETGTGHVAVTVCTLDVGGFSLGRLDRDEEAVMLNADIRVGRSFDQQRAFVLAAFDAAHKHWGIPTANMYAVVTEHAGEQFHEYDHVLSGWSKEEAETGPN